MEKESPKRVLAVASGGGHWIQLSRMFPALVDCEVAYMTTQSGYRYQVSPARFYVVYDANMRKKFGMIWMAFQILMVLLWERPHVVMSTGAAPGFFAVRLGKLLGAKTIWVDSMANAEQLSASGVKVGRHADVWLTQWPHLATPTGPYFEGAVL
jgi:UDP-N-acetylglucosamine:LPS N-acetylglucosamine transferase